ncbi:molybdopterin-guanine dinucleotide biosynthesis protein B [Pontibacillus yanchengensis]|uniref:Molybdopterin-guanine dinucleotide biosynthesis protein B n=1 Tax=Pontibacillus yanchengensis Y32 TaxID=1385514 RepID=A0A0A2TFR8_9BACI|nr:molybdopterin-guanine dinucleotide biosynthesis protein B [Pontibacillus yanchengensis]KGP74374.1 molybdopterin-guanine dinucleotide biosynthesis protein B [Pontibacillus yanchengensis Y32]
MNRHPFVVWQIVGYKNSGKTTVVSGLIRELQQQGYRVGALKHHGHGGPPMIQDEDTDSGKHRHAGAIVSGVEGDGLFHFIAKKQHWSLEEMLHVYEVMDIDIVLLEGFKHATYPKTVILKDKQDLSLVEECSFIDSYLYWTHQPLIQLKKSEAAFPIYHSQSIQDVSKRIIERCEGNE